MMGPHTAWQCPSLPGLSGTAQSRVYHGPGHGTGNVPASAAENECTRICLSHAARASWTGPEGAWVSLTARHLLSLSQCQTLS
eukprot:1537480-Rhodomonas_salina.1